MAGDRPKKRKPGRAGREVDRVGIAEPPVRSDFGTPRVGGAAPHSIEGNLRELRDQMLLDHLPLVKTVALRIHETLSAHVDLDDLIHAGVLGLFEAVENHRPGANIEFPIYAEHQIRHAILESLRDPDRWSRSFGLATAQAEMANGEEPSAAQERAPFGRTARMPRLDRITRNPGIMGGKPCLRGMRVTVGTLVGLCAAGHSFPEILEAYPYIQEEDIRQALAYAAWRVQELELPLPAA